MTTPTSPTDILTPDTTTAPDPTSRHAGTPSTDRVPSGDELTVIAWRDPIVEAVPGAMPTDSDDALVWWTPTIGTIGMVMAHRFARQAAVEPTWWTIEDIGRTFGISPTPPRVHGVIDRLHRFGIVRHHADTLAVRLWLPPLTLRQRRRLPAYLADAWDAR
jgi:hypothetical protein